MNGVTIRKIITVHSLVSLIILGSCTQDSSSALDILNKTINSIDTIETIYYKQDMIRTNPRQLEETIFRYREMCFQRLIQDSIVGVKGHWYFYGNDGSTVNYEDIFDGNRLIRKNNLDSAIRLYDLIKYPEFSKEHFWSHNTLYGLQYVFKYILDHTGSYQLIRLNDTIFMDKNCFQIVIYLEDKMTMPGFATQLEDSEGNITKTLFIIDKQNYYPVRMKEESYSNKNPGQKYFIDQTYYDIKFNFEVEEHIIFNTSSDHFTGYVINEIVPENTINKNQ